MNEGELLDENLAEERLQESEFSIASACKRFANLIIDTICYYLVVILLVFFLTLIGLSRWITESSAPGNEPALYLFVFGVHFLYYSSLETIFGKTVGKMITKTKVVNQYGSRITFGEAAGRSLSRLIPFESFTFFRNHPVGLHDRLPKTRVVDDR